jgi:acetyl-CoA carboxylase biotin carboxylase subunit
MHRALLELTIDGLDTSRDFHLRVMEDEEFRRGDIEIQWLERRLPSLTGQVPTPAGMRAAAIAAALFAERDRGTRTASSGAGTGAVAEPAPSAREWVRTARREGLR